MVRHDFHQFDRRSTLFEHYLDGGGHRFFGNRPNLFSKLDNSTYLGKHFNFTSLCISRLLSRKNIPTSVRRHPHQTSSSKGRCPGILLICVEMKTLQELCIDESLWMLLDDVLYMVLSITLSFSFVLVCDQPSGLLLEGVLCCHIVFLWRWWWWWYLKTPWCCFISTGISLSRELPFNICSWKDFVQR